MNPIMLFQTGSVLPEGKYLPGVYAWTYAVRLERAEVQARCPASGKLKLQLEVNGALTGNELTVVASGSTDGLTGGPYTASLDLGGIRVPAGQTIRWRAAYAGPIEAAAMQVALTVTAVPDSKAGVTARAAVLSIQWESSTPDGRTGERLTVADYNAGVFTARPVASGRMTVVQDGLNGIVFSILGTEVLRAESGVLRIPGLVAVGGVAVPTSARPVLRFQQDGSTVASLVAGRFYVRSVVEATPPAEGFEFWSGGVRTASLTMAGLVTLGISEP